MKKIGALIIACVFLFSAIVVNAEEEKDEKVSVEYEFSRPEIRKVNINNNIYDQVILEDVTNFGNPGEPLIPMKGAYILLPENTEATDITIIHGEVISLGKGFNLEPVGDLVTTSQNLRIKPSKSSKEIYASSEMYPGELYSEVGTYYFRGYPILVLTLYPVQYIPSSGELFYYPDIKVDVETSKINENQFYRSNEEDRIEVFKKIDNPNILETYDENKIIKTNNQGYDLLILTTADLKSGFQPLKTAHENKGLSTEIKTLSEISLVPGSITPEDIREFIRQEYQENGIEYLLIGGDIDKVPMKKLYVSGYDEDNPSRPYETELPVDQYYGYLDGPFNNDGDELWGEPEDGENGGDVDLYAEVYVGRACVDDTNDVNNFVQKTVSYIETSNDDGYLSNVIFAGEFLGAYPTLNFGGDLNDLLIDGSDKDGFTTVGVPSSKYDITKIYDRDWPGFDPDDHGSGWSASDLLQDVNQNVHILHHDGHSNYIYNMKMTIDYVSSFTNTKSFFAYSSGCMAGGFDYEDYDCFAEYMTVKTNNGAFAGLWNARYGWFWAGRTDGDGTMHSRQFYDAIFGEKITAIGEANQDSKEDNLHLLQRSMMRWTNYGLNLFGDPSVSFHVSNPPEKPELNGPASGNAGETYKYTTTTTDPDGDSLQYLFDWGDGEKSDWLGPYSSGETVEDSHTWSKKGNFQVKVIAKDSNGEESEWSDPIDISIPRGRSITNNFLLKIIDQIFFRLQNIIFYPFL